MYQEPIKEVMCCGMPMSKFMGLGSVECERLRKEENDKFYDELNRNRKAIGFVSDKTKNNLSNENALFCNKSIADHELDFKLKMTYDFLKKEGKSESEITEIVNNNSSIIEDNNYRDLLLLLMMKYMGTKESKVEQKKKPQKTYLMINNQNGYYKIGKSVDPKHRERTLQSQEPDIELIATYDNDIESLLHKKFDAHRLRGEWFELSKCNVSDILINYFKKATPNQ